MDLGAEEAAGIGFGNVERAIGSDGHTVGITEQSGLGPDVEELALFIESEDGAIESGSAVDETVGGVVEAVDGMETGPFGEVVA